MPDLGVGKGFVQGVHRRGHHVCRTQTLHHVIYVSFGKLGLQVLIERGFVLQAKLSGLKARVRHQVLTFDRAADIMEELVIERGNLNVPAILTPERSVGRIKRTGIPDARLDVLTEKELADLGRLDVDQPVHQTQLNLLANALLLAGPQADHGGKGDQIGTGGVGDGRTGLQGLAVPLSGDAHKAGQRLGEGVNARPAAIRSVLAKGADGDADNFLVVLTRFFVRHPPAWLWLGGGGCRQ